MPRETLIPTEVGQPVLRPRKDILVNLDILDTAIENQVRLRKELEENRHKPKHDLLNRQIFGSVNLEERGI